MAATWMAQTALSVIRPLEIAPVKVQESLGGLVTHVYLAFSSFQAVSPVAVTQLGLWRGLCVARKQVCAAVNSL